MTLKSLFADIENAPHTFAAFAEKEYVKLYNAAPKIEHVADVAFKYCLPAISMLVTAEAGAPAGALVASIGAEAQKDLIAASGLLYDFGPSPNAASMISGVSANLSTLLTDSHVTNSASIDKVTKVVSSLNVLASAIQTTVGTVAATPAPAVESAPAVSTVAATKEVL